MRLRYRAVTFFLLLSASACGVETEQDADIETATDELRRAPAWTRGWSGGSGDLYDVEAVAEAGGSSSFGDDWTSTCASFPTQASYVGLPCTARFTVDVRRRTIRQDVSGWATAEAPIANDGTFSFASEATGGYSRVERVAIEGRALSNGRVVVGATKTMSCERRYVNGHSFMAVTFHGCTDARGTARPRWP